MDLKEVFLVEKNKIGSFNGELSIRIDVDKTEHATSRQGRHGDSNIISDEKITKIVEKAYKKLLKALLFNRIDIGDTVVIRDMTNYINLVCRLSPLGENVEVVVITVMQKSDFKTDEFTVQVWG